MNFDVGQWSSNTGVVGQLTLCLNNKQVELEGIECEEMEEKAKIYMEVDWDGEFFFLTKPVYVVEIYPDNNNVKHIFKVGSMKKGLQGNAMSVKFLQWSGNTCNM